MQIAHLLYGLTKLINNMFSKSHKMKELDFDKFKIKFEKPKPKREMTAAEYSAWGIAKWCAMLNIPPDKSLTPPASPNNGN